MMRLQAALVLMLFFVVLALCADALAEPALSRGFVVIVNSTNQASDLDRGFVTDVFLKKITHWPNDEAIRPADLLPNSPARRKFTEEVLRRSVEAVKGYWQQRIFSGRDVPPPEFESDEDVLKYVLRYPGAIGYVSAGTTTSGAKVVSIR